MAKYIIDENNIRDKMKKYSTYSNLIVNHLKDKKTMKSVENLE